MEFPPPQPTSPEEHDGSSAITAIHPDIIRTHILTRLDGPTLASATCASSPLRSLTDYDALWKSICNSHWPSTSHPLVLRSISAFPSAHRSFYTSCFPTFHLHAVPRCPGSASGFLPPTSQLIFAVDIHYQDRPVFSRVSATETTSGWFQQSPLRIDLLDPKETVTTPVRLDPDDEGLLQLEERMNLSWIVIDPTRKRAVDVSSRAPVLVQRHWLTGDIQIRYATVMNGEDGSGELVQCKVEVTCGGKEGGEVQVKEVSMWVEDIDGKILSGRESLAVLQGAMGSERRRRRRGDERKRYEDYETAERERRVRRHRRQRRTDLALTVAGFAFFMIFWLSVYFLIFPVPRS